MYLWFSPWLNVSPAIFLDFWGAPNLLHPILIQHTIPIRPSYISIFTLRRNKSIGTFHPDLHFTAQFRPQPIWPDQMSAPSPRPRHHQTFPPETKKIIHFWFHKHFCKVLHIMWRCCCGLVLACETDSPLASSFPLIQRCWAYHLRSHQVASRMQLCACGLSQTALYSAKAVHYNSQGSWQQTPFWCEKTTQKLNYSCGLWLWVSDSYL